jgi:hypothetical protein
MRQVSVRLTRGGYKHSSISPLSRYSSCRSSTPRPRRRSCLSRAALVGEEGANTAGLPRTSSSITTPEGMQGNRQCSPTNQHLIQSCRYNVWWTRCKALLQHCCATCVCDVCLSLPDVSATPAAANQRETAIHSPPCLQPMHRWHDFKHIQLQITDV